MYCKNCGKEIDNNAAICIHCGVAVTRQEEKQEEKQETNTLAIVGFILSFFVAIAGLICSIIGYKRAAKLGNNGKGLAIAGIIISALSMGIVIIYVIIAIMALGAIIV